MKLASQLNRNYLKDIKELITLILNSNLTTYSAAISFISLFSLVPLITLIASLVQVIPKNLYNKMIEQIQLINNAELEIALTKMMGNFEESQKIEFSLINLIILIVTGTGFINFLQKSIDKITDIKRSKSQIKKWFIRRFISSSIIISFVAMAFILIGFGLILAKIFSTTSLIIKVLSITQPFIFLFICLYISIRYLPATRVNRVSAIISSICCSTLFAFINLSFSIVINNLSFLNHFGQAKALIIILLWVFVHSLIFLSSIIFAFKLDPSIKDQHNQNMSKFAH